MDLKYSFDPNWFRCAQKAGGRLELIWSVGQGGPLAARAPIEVTTPSARVPVKELCATPGRKQVQVDLKGSGPMERLDWGSSIVEAYCATCQWPGGDTMALRTKAPTPPGTWTLVATFDPKWYACAKPGSTLELRIFTGASREDAKNATEPVLVVKELEGPKVKRTFPSAPVCYRKPKFVGVDFAGTGELRVLALKGRQVYESPCP